MIQQNFNADWKFYKEGEETKKITLPHDAMLEEKRIPDLIAGENSAYFPGGKYASDCRQTWCWVLYPAPFFF